MVPTIYGQNQRVEIEPCVGFEYGWGHEQPSRRITLIAHTRFRFWARKKCETKTPAKAAHPKEPEETVALGRPDRVATHVCDHLKNVITVG